MSKPKYNIGDTVYWIYSSCHYGKKIPCTMCFGKKAVQIILGDGSTINSECGFCSHGLDRATGLTQVWMPHAEIKSGEITGLEKEYEWKYKVGHEHLSEYDLFSNKEDALAPFQERLLQVQKQAENFFKESFVSAIKSQIWNAGYHKECIKRAEQTIEWHQTRLAMIKEKRITATRERDEG